MSSFTLDSHRIPDLLGSYRITVPFRLTKIARAVIHLVWFEENDRQSMIRIQSAVSRSNPFQLPENLPEFSVGAGMSIRASRIIVNNHDLSSKNRARHWYAAAARFLAKNHKIQTGINMPVAYAGLVERRAHSDPIPQALMSLIGETSIDEKIIASDDKQATAMVLALATFDAIQETYPHLFG